ncbi:MAG: PQQ-binding-like beta-propeller repeat protein [Halobaculum sp.]
MFLRRLGAVGTAALTTGLAGCTAFGESAESDPPTVNPALAGTPTETPTRTPGPATWSATVSGAVPPVVLGGRVLVSQGPPESPQVLGLDPADGSVAWAREFSTAITPDTDGRLFTVSSELGTDDPFGVVLDPATGDLLWETDSVVGVETSTQTHAAVELWKPYGNGPDRNVVLDADWEVAWEVAGEPRQLTTQQLLVTRLAGRVATVEQHDADTGAFAWRREWATDARIGWLGTHRDLAVAVVGERVFALSTADGTTRATATNETGFDASSVAGGGRRYYGWGFASGDGGVFLLDAEAESFHDRTLGAAARPVAYHDGPVLQLTDGDRQWVAAYTPDVRERRWQRPGIAVADGPEGVYVARGQRVTALAVDGAPRWRVTPDLGSTLGDVDSLTEWDYPVVRLDDVLVVTGRRGMATYSARDGSQRRRVTGLGPVRGLLPRLRFGTTEPPAGHVVLVTGGAVHAIPLE